MILGWKKKKRHKYIVFLKMLGFFYFYFSSSDYAFTIAYILFAQGFCPRCLTGLKSPATLPGNIAVPLCCHLGRVEVQATLVISPGANFGPWFRIWSRFHQGPTQTRTTSEAERSARNVSRRKRKNCLYIKLNFIEKKKNSKLFEKYKMLA